MNGFLSIDKPQGPSSFDIVRKLRRALSAKRIGHCGTLDPLASGVLVLGVGSATRLMQYLPTEPKIYQFTIVFGRATETYDSEGATTAEGPLPAESTLRAVLPQFTGSISQHPPRFSAVKIQGKRAYKMARKGESFEVPARKVMIHELTIEHYDVITGTATARVTCAGGTYVRSLANDIAVALGTAAHAGSIRRTQVGQFGIAQATSLEGDLAGNIETVSSVFRHCRRMVATEEQVALLKNGRSLEIDTTTDDHDEPVFVFDTVERLVAVTRPEKPNQLHPERVFDYI